MRQSLFRLSAGFFATMMALPPSTLMAQSNSNSSTTIKKDVIGATKDQLVVGKQYYISADKLNVRSSTQTAGMDNVVGKLSTNDVVEIVDLLHAATPLVQIKIIKSASFQNTRNLDLFVSKDYLSEKALEQISSGQSRFFVVQNVATEMTRVYERCTTTPNCPHKLVLETEMVVGRPEEGTKDNRYAFTTWLGHAKISEWVKFYQDNAGHYPHWYRQGQSLSSLPPKAPGNAEGKPESSFFWGRKWITQDAKKEDTIYGAFGWYAAKVHPGGETEGMNYQWIHGTIGWASDKQAPIELTRSFLLNLLSNPGSAGCTRLSNGQVSYLRHLLPVGTDIYRVYAREATRESACAKKSFWGSCKQERILTGYSAEKSRKWDYIMLTDGAQKTGGLTADAETIRRLGVQVIPGLNLIEAGSIDIDQYPNPIYLDYMKTAASGKSGDRYRIDDEYGKNPTNFRGVYLVDEGRFIDYQHPSREATNGKIRVSGLAEFRASVPEFLKTTGNYFVEETVYRKDNNDPYKSKSNERTQQELNTLDLNKFFFDVNKR